SSDSVVGSIQPLFTSADLVFDGALAGVWKGAGGNESGESVVLEPRGDNGYTMIVRDDEGREEARFEAWLVNLHGETFLDILPEAPAVSPQNLKLDLTPSENPIVPHLRAVADQVVLSIEPDENGDKGRAYKTRFIRLHWFYKVRTDGRAMRLTGLSPDWLQEEVNEGRILIDHQPLGEDATGFVVSASTTDLQQLVLDHSFDPKAFHEEDSAEYSRAPEE
ncbi:MAG TPA: hypothetical protein VFM21_05880, partial [Terriglobia bacterium]|nr:hypothetical protein [Terriglobia bacterium]